jgi:hypothetical protein
MVVSLLSVQHMKIYGSPARVELRLLEFEIGTDWLERILRALEKEISRGWRHFEQLGKSGNADDLQYRFAEDGEQVEEMLGVAFVACQTFVIRLMIRLRRLNEVCESKFGAELPSGIANLGGALKKGTKLTGRQLTDVEAIYSLANYWKH